MMVKEALVVISTLSQLMSGKMDKPILHVTGWANRRIAIVVVSSYLRVLELSPMGTLGLSPSPGYNLDVSTGMTVARQSSVQQST